MEVLSHWSKACSEVAGLVVDGVQVHRSDIVDLIKLRSMVHPKLVVE